jgi:hypothetical protein
LPATCGGGQGKPGCSGPSAERPGYFFVRTVSLANARGVVTGDWWKIRLKPFLLTKHFSGFQFGSEISNLRFEISDEPDSKNDKR